MRHDIKFYTLLTRSFADLERFWPWQNYLAFSSWKSWGIILTIHHGANAVNVNMFLGREK